MSKCPKCGGKRTLPRSSQQCTHCGGSGRSAGGQGPLDAESVDTGTEVNVSNTTKNPGRQVKLMEGVTR